MNRISPRDVLNPMIDRRASKIEDPVEKLRFLRQSQAKVDQVHGVLSHPKYWWIRSRKLWLTLGLLILVPTVTLMRSTSNQMVVPASLPANGRTDPRAFREAPLEKVWLVETKNGVESWSNGLRIETKYRTGNRPRQYYVWNRNQAGATLTQLPVKQPAGIVFHTTESTLEELEEQKTRRLKLLGEGLLNYVKQEKAYNYVIDRFGRVFRVVEEGEAANHAGKSVWADDKWAYIGLNDSFLGISFETQSRAGEESAIISQAQIDAGRMLTRMLRARYNIPASNCATHAQVSINPSVFLIGYHTDWAGNFPFEDFGLPDNYAQPLASIYLFGFSFDSSFLEATGVRMWNGVVIAEDMLREQARQKSLSVAQLKSQLRNEYRRLSALLPETPRSAEKKNDESSDPSGKTDQPSKEETK